MDPDSDFSKANPASRGEGPVLRISDPSRLLWLRYNSSVTFRLLVICHLCRQKVASHPLRRPMRCGGAAPPARRIRPMTHPFRRQTLGGDRFAARRNIRFRALRDLVERSRRARRSGQWGTVGQAMVCVMPYRVRRSDAWRGQRSGLRHDRQDSWLQRAEHRAIPLGSASQDAGHATDAKRGQRPRRLYRKSRAVSPLAQEIEGRAS